MTTATTENQGVSVVAVTYCLSACVAMRDLTGRFGKVMDFLREASWLPSSYNRRYHERETAVAMNIIDQLSTYIYLYVDKYQKKIYFKKIMILFLP